MCGNFSAYFPVGLKLEIYVECLNSNRDVIVRTVTKSITVGSSENNVNFNLMTEGNEIIPPVSPPFPPAPPAPVQGQVTYFGNGATGGVVLTAKWIAIQYTVNFNGDGAQGSENSINFTVEDTGKSFPTNTVFNKPGNTFQHWATGTGVGTPISLEYIIDQLKLGNPINGLTIGSNNDITVYAVWNELSTLYVSDVGSDANIGTSASPLTITKAFEIASASSTAKTIEVQANISGVAVTQTGGNITLKLNGNTLTGDGTKPVISINGGSLTLEDSGGGTGKITGGNGGVQISGGTTFTMRGGEISGNTSNSGGGVYMYGTSTFIMEGGKITNNFATYDGGGVLVGGTFTMNGGEITNNKCGQFGGGVYNASIFNGTGGTLSGNKASYDRNQSDGGTTAKNSDWYGGTSYQYSGSSLFCFAEFLQKRLL